MAPGLLKRLFDNPLQRRDNEKRRLLTQKDRNLRTCVIDDPKTSTHKKPSSADIEKRNKNDIETRCIQICPHETLSFERMKRIVHLTLFKSSGDRIGAFTSAPGFHHVPSETGTHLCKPHQNTFKSLEADSYYTHMPDFDGVHDGLVLCVHWTMDFDHIMDVIANSLSNLQSFLDALDINLCRHIKMDDSKIVARLYGVCNQYRLAEDPVEAYEERRRCQRSLECKKCYSAFRIYEEDDKCHIVVKRYLGMGSSAYDRRWLVQCGEEGYKLRSFGAAAAQIWKSNVSW